MRLPYFGHKVLLRATDSRGMTLIELLIALAIGSMISIAALMAVNQILVQSPRARNHIFATNQAQAAGYWIDRDGSCAQVITPTPNLFTVSTGTPLVISYVSWDATRTTITYTVDTSHRLQRQVSVINERTGSVISSGQTQVAYSIASITAQYDYPPNSAVKKILTVAITAQVGSGSVASDNVTRAYQISPRPFSQ
jgi:prepilin-type N-terminal cleavage/methylation domain-containing protein